MRRTLPLILGAFLVGGGGCTCGQEGEEPEAAETPTAAPAATASEDSLARVRAETAEITRAVGRVVHFDFDRSTIRPGEDAQILEEKVAILQANPDLTIEVTGHCDERGSNTYNMALGDRRAQSVKRFLTNRGIGQARITTRSMGEQSPVDPGHNQAAWARNRRTEFTITTGGDELRQPSGG
jgi:peptidoglycan-associated lipoprotein